MAAGKEVAVRPSSAKQDELEGAQDDRRAHRWALRAQSRHASSPSSAAGSIMATVAPPKATSPPAMTIPTVQDDQ